MSQHDYVIANQSGSAFRADLNNALAASVSTNSGSSAPSTTYAYMLWADSTNNLIKLRNSANNAWITLFTTAGGLDVDAASNFNEDVTFTGASANVTWDKSADDLIFNDNAKAIFGTSSDGVEIYHDGSNSYISDGGTGDLYIRGSSNVRITDPSNNKMILCQDGGEVQLYHDGTEKLNTQANGIDIAGNLKITGSGNSPNSANWDTASAVMTSGSYGGGISMIDGSAGFVQYLSSSGANWWLKSGADDATPETNIKAVHGGAVELSWDGGTKLATTSSGITVTGTVNETSDISLKNNINTIQNPLDLIEQIRGINFTWKNNGMKSMGVIAQDVEKVFPELVHGQEGSKTLQYSGLIGALVESVKELSAKVAALETK